MAEKKENSKAKPSDQVWVVWTANVKHHGKRYRAREKTMVSPDEKEELVAAKVAELVEQDE